MSSVEQIIDALTSLETDLDNLNSRVNDMKKRIIAYSISEIEKQKQKVIAIANEDAKAIIDTARKEAENESAVIMAETEKITTTTKRNIANSLPHAVDFVVKTISGQTDLINTSKNRDEAPLDRFEPRNMIAVATVYGRSYYNIVNALKLMDLTYESLSPEQADSSDTGLVITTKDESGIIHRKNVLLDTELDEVPVLSKAKILRAIMRYSKDESLIIGVDPGYRIGISVIYFHNEIESFVEHSPQSAIEIISVILSGIISRRKLVKIGDGNISMCNDIAKALKMKFKDSVVIEIVDEYGTSLRRSAYSNRRGIRDCSSAKAIAFRTGKVL